MADLATIISQQTYQTHESPLGVVDYWTINLTEIGVQWSTLQQIDRPSQTKTNPIPNVTRTFSHKIYMQKIIRASSDIMYLRSLI